jgi:hypothetical protein
MLYTICSAYGNGALDAELFKIGLLDFGQETLTLTTNFGPRSATRLIMLEGYSSCVFTKADKRVYKRARRIPKYRLKLFKSVVKNSDGILFHQKIIFLLQIIENQYGK